jgi:hypothetical protein
MSAEAKEIDVFAFLKPLPQQAGRPEIGGDGYPNTLPVPLADLGHDFSQAARAEYPQIFRACSAHHRYGAQRY